MFSLLHSLCLTLSRLSGCDFSQLRRLALSLPPPLPLTFSLSPLHTFSVSTPNLSSLPYLPLSLTLGCSFSSSLPRAPFFCLLLSLPHRQFAFTPPLTVSFSHTLSLSLLGPGLLSLPFCTLFRCLSHTLALTFLHTLNFSLDPHSLSLPSSQDLKQRERGRSEFCKPAWKAGLGWHLTQEGRCYIPGWS